MVNLFFEKFVGVICSGCGERFASITEVQEQGTWGRGGLIHKACNEKRITDTAKAIVAGNVISRINWAFPGTPVWRECFHLNKVEATIYIVRELDKLYPGWEYAPILDRFVFPKQTPGLDILAYIVEKA